jgi:uncharacterized protein
MTLEDVRKLFQTEALKELCRQHDVAQLSVFGSTARNEATEQSDLDLLVSFSKAKGFFEFCAFELQLEQITNRKVDLVTENGLSPRLRDTVLPDLQIIYAG